MLVVLRVPPQQHSPRISCLLAIQKWKCSTLAYMHRQSGNTRPHAQWPAMAAHTSHRGHCFLAQTVCPAWTETLLQGDQRAMGAAANLKSYDVDSPHARKALQSTYEAISENGAPMPGVEVRGMGMPC